MKKVKNADSVSRTWVGQTIAAGAYYTLSPSEYPDWATDSTVLSAVGSGLAVVNDGSADLTVADGIALLNDNFTKPTGAGIYFNGSLAITTRTETDLAGTTYTVPSGASFWLSNFYGSYDSQTPMYIRLKKQTGGSGAFVELYRLSLCIGGASGQSSVPLDFAIPVKVGVAGDVFKITYEGTLPKGNVTASFAGIQN